MALYDNSANSANFARKTNALVVVDILVDSCISNMKQANKFKGNLSSNFLFQKFSDTKT